MNRPGFGTKILMANPIVPGGALLVEILINRVPVLMLRRPFRTKIERYYLR